MPKQKTQIKTTEQAREMQKRAVEARKRNDIIRAYDNKSLADITREELDVLVSVGEERITKKRAIVRALLRDVMQNPTPQNVRALKDILNESTQKIEGEINIKKIALNYEFGSANGSNDD